MNQEHVAALALPRQSGHMLFYSFFGRGGEEEKTFEKPWGKGTQVLGFLYDQIRITSETETMSLC